MARNSRPASWRGQLARRRADAKLKPTLEGQPQPCTAVGCDHGWVTTERGDLSPCSVCGGYGCIDPGKEAVIRLGGALKKERF